MKNKYILILLLSTIACSQKTLDSSRKQDECKKSYDRELKMDIYSFSDQMPEFPGGQPKLFLFFAKNLKFSGKSDYQGGVIFSFVVDNKGYIIDKKIYNKSKENYTAFEKEALHVLDSMPLWNPGKCNGKEVPVRVIVPIKF